MITSRSDFRGDIQIANADDVAPMSNLIGNAQYLDDAIQKYEREVLIKLLGLGLYNEFIEQFDQSIEPWQLLPTADVKWKNLLDGTEYLRHGTDVEFVGLKKIVPYYIYFKFIEEDELRHTGVGFVKDEAKNARVQLGRSKWAYACNKFVDYSYHVHGYLSYFRDDYPKWRRRRHQFAHVNRFGL